MAIRRRKAKRAIPKDRPECLNLLVPEIGVEPTTFALRMGFFVNSSEFQSTHHPGFIDTNQHFSRIRLLICVRLRAMIAVHQRYTGADSWQKRRSRQGVSETFPCPLESLRNS